MTVIAAKMIANVIVFVPARRPFEYEENKHTYKCDVKAFFLKLN